jgi:hypothetical protein
MDVLFRYISRYSPPVIVAIITLVIGGYFIKYGIERTLEAEFQKRDRELELAMKRQSNFQEKVLWQKYSLLTSQNEILHQLRAEIHGYILGTAEQTFVKNGHVYRLTDVYEQLNINRFLIGEEMYRLMTQHAATLQRFSKLKSKQDKAYGETITLFLEIDEQYRYAMREVFNIGDTPYWQTEAK